jgi:hypothetical protein
LEKVNLNLEEEEALEMHWDAGDSVWTNIDADEEVCAWDLCYPKGFLTFEDGTDRLSRNFTEELPLYAA